MLALQERRGRRVDVLELRIAIRMRAALLGLAQRLEPVAERMQEMANGRGTHAPPLRRQRRGQLRTTLTRPSQRRHRITARQRLDQQIQRLRHARLGLLDVGTPRSGTANPPGGLHALRQLATPVPNRLPGQSRRRRHERVTAIADRHRFSRRPQATRPLIEHRRHDDKLPDDGGFHVGVAFHAPGLSTLLCTLAS